MAEILEPTVEPEVKSELEKLEEVIPVLTSKIGITKACHTKSKRYLKIQNASRRKNSSRWNNRGH
jgi:hypothetical protein